MKKTLLAFSVAFMLTLSAFCQKDYSVTNMIFKIDSVINNKNIEQCNISFGTGNGGYWIENLQFYFDDFFLVTTEDKKNDKVKTYYNMDRLRRFYIEDGVIVFVF